MKNKDKEDCLLWSRNHPYNSGPELFVRGCFWWGEFLLGDTILIKDFRKKVADSSGLVNWPGSFAVSQHVYRNHPLAILSATLPTLSNKEKSRKLLALCRRAWKELEG